MTATPSDSGSGERPPQAGPPEQVGAGFDFADPNSRLAPYYLRTSHVIAVSILAATFFLLNYVPLWHTDIWGHLKFGQWIVENQELPDKDPFCPFADEVGSLRYPGQLGQAFFYLIFRAGELAAGGSELDRLAGGVDALRLFHAVIVTLRLLVMLIAFRRVSGSLSVACGALVVLLIFSVGNIGILRPQVLGEFFFALLLLALSRPVLSLRALLLTPILLVVWANAHGSFGAGLLLIACVALGRAAELARRNIAAWLAGLRADAQCRRLAAVLVVSTLAIALCNPSGRAIYGQVLAMAQHPVVRLQDEWQPLGFHLGSGGHWTFFALVVLVIATQAFCTRWFSVSSILLIVVFGLQPWRHQRMLVWLLMIVPWVLARYWPDCSTGSLARWSTLQSVPSFRKTLLAASLCGLAAVWSIPGQWIVSGAPGKLERTLSGGTCWQLAAVLRDPRHDVPASYEALAMDLRERYPQQKYTGCIFASETLGDYLLWQLSPEIPVFVYTHVHLFKLEHWREVETVRSGKQGWRETLDRHGVNLVVVNPAQDTQLCAQLRKDPHWHVVRDEANNAAKRDPRTWLFVALRKVPVRSN